MFILKNTVVSLIEQIESLKTENNLLREEVDVLQAVQTVSQGGMNCSNGLTNKKVLLRERRRHTADRVASARFAVLSHRDARFSGCVTVVALGVP